MIVCGLDQAPSGTGWAYGDGSGPPRTGYQQFPDYGENESALIDYIFDWLVTFGKSAGIEAVYTEQIVVNPRAINMPVLLKQCAVVCAVASACGKRGLNIPHYQAEIASWRVRFLGVGGAPKGINGSRSDWLKNAACKACMQRGLLIDNHHIAEAVGIFDFGLSELDRKYRATSDVLSRRQREKALAPA